MNSDNNQEMFPLVDEQGNITGAATRGECHNGSKLLHPVIHLHVFNSKGELYMQKRPEWKDIQPAAPPSKKSITVSSAFRKCFLFGRLCYFMSGWLLS